MQQQTASLPKPIQSTFAQTFVTPQANQLSKSNEQNNKLNPLLVLPQFNQTADKLNSQSSSNNNKSHSSKNNNEFIDLINKLNNNQNNNNISNDNLIPMISLYSPLTKQCQWPECQSNDVKYDSFESYLKLHLSKEHPIDQKSHQIIIKQLNTIDKLELELKKQNQLLNDMLFHLRSQLNVLKQQQQQQQSNQNNQMFFAAMAAAAAAGRNVNDNNFNNQNITKKNMKTSVIMNDDENNMVDYNNEEDNSDEDGDDYHGDVSHGKNENDENDSSSQFRRPFERSSLSLSVGMYSYFDFRSNKNNNFDL
jgi:hypothetical protein